jgi:hypothetical protein
VKVYPTGMGKRVALFKKKIIIKKEETKNSKSNGENVIWMS